MQQDALIDVDKNIQIDLSYILNKIDIVSKNEIEKQKKEIFRNNNVIISLEKALSDMINDDKSVILESIKNEKNKLL